MSEAATQEQADMQAEAERLIAYLRRWARWSRNSEMQRMVLKAADYIEVETTKKK